MRDFKHASKHIYISSMSVLIYTTMNWQQGEILFLWQKKTKTKNRKQKQTKINSSHFKINLDHLPWLILLQQTVTSTTFEYFSLFKHRLIMSNEKFLLHINRLNSSVEFDLKISRAAFRSSYLATIPKIVPPRNGKQNRRVIQNKKNNIHAHTPTQCCKHPISKIC